MQFHDYLTLRTIELKHGTIQDMKARARRMTADEYRKLMASAAADSLRKAKTSEERTLAASRVSTAVAEHLWAELERPYYNVWPIALDLSQRVRLELPFASFKIPFAALVLRFGRGHEPYAITTSMLFWDKNRIQITAWFLGSDEVVNLEMLYKEDEQVEDWINRFQREWPSHTDIGNTLVRLVVFVGLLSHDRDTITPIVLSKDQAKYDSAKTPDERKWLEDRAARRAGRGFEVCKKLELEREISPHWRNPHLCLFWTGEGRTVPIIKMRSGAIIQRVSMADVPTGYLGPEKHDELDSLDNKTPREPISKSRRFDIMKRDGFRCRLCGATQDQGARLHVDHRVALAKGGSNEDDNLWTLCEPCNLGKSDKDLVQE